MVSLNGTNIETGVMDIEGAVLVHALHFLPVVVSKTSPSGHTVGDKEPPPLTHVVGGAGLLSTVEVTMPVFAGGNKCHSCL